MAEGNIGDKPEEFENFEDLARRLLVVSKEDLDVERQKDRDAPTDGPPKPGKIV